MSGNYGSKVMEKRKVSEVVKSPTGVSGSYFKANTGNLTQNLQSLSRSRVSSVQQRAQQHQT